LLCLLVGEPRSSLIQQVEQWLDKPVDACANQSSHFFTPVDFPSGPREKASQ
jgi:hypothetical protein